VDVRDAEVWAEFESVFRFPTSEPAIYVMPEFESIALNPRLPWLDLYAGSGHVARALATQYPSARIYAVEPAVAHRAALMAAVAADVAIRSRVSVFSEWRQLKNLSGQIGGAFLLSALHLLTPHERRELLGFLLDVLIADAPILVTAETSSYPSDLVQPRMLAEAVIGEQSVQRWVHWRRVSDREVAVTNIFRVLYRGELSREAVTTVHRFDLTYQQLLELFASHHYRLSSGTDDILVFARQDRRTRS
jgi:hypothetical protein